VRRSVPGNIVLIGFSGTGKTTVGRYLARQLGWPFVDTDQLVVDRFGLPIARLFVDRGEAFFRAAERDAVAAACAGRGQVISVGGGAPVDPTNQACMRDGNQVVCLSASPETILWRLHASPNAEERPMLAGADPRSRVRTLLPARADAYAIANLVVDTENKDAETVGLEILERLGDIATGTTGNGR
jgi:shikimate kinase